MAVNCYATVRPCTECVLELVKLINNATNMNLFESTETLSFVAIYILGEIIRTKRRKWFLLVITNRATEFTRTIHLRRITATAVAQVFVNNFVFSSGTPQTVFSDNGGKFMTQLFTETCWIIGTENVYTKMYYPKFNVQVERFNRTILS